MIDPNHVNTLIAGEEAKWQAILARETERLERELADAEMMLRRLVYRHRKGIETSEEEWGHIARIASRNSSPHRGRSE
jgi:hypothetical protein